MDVQLQTTSRAIHACFQYTEFGRPQEREACACRLSHNDVPHRGWCTRASSPWCICWQQRQCACLLLAHPLTVTNVTHCQTVDCFEIWLSATPRLASRCPCALYQLHRRSARDPIGHSSRIECKVLHDSHVSAQLVALGTSQKEQLQDEANDTRTPGRAP